MTTSACLSTSSGEESYQSCAALCAPAPTLKRTQQPARVPLEDTCPGHPGRKAGNQRFRAPVALFARVRTVVARFSLANADLQLDRAIEHAARAAQRCSCPAEASSADPSRSRLSAAAAIAAHAYTIPRVPASMSPSPPDRRGPPSTSHRSRCSPSDIRSTAPFCRIATPPNSRHTAFSVVSLAVFLPASHTH